MMLRRWRIRLVGAVVTVCALGITVPPLVNPAQAQIEWKLSSFVPVGSATWKTFHEPFINTVHTLTDRKIKIKGYSVGALAGPFDTWKAVQRGVVDVCLCFSAFIANIDPVNTSSPVLPGA